jgi:hypothetical protein
MNPTEKRLERRRLWWLDEFRRWVVLLFWGGGAEERTGVGFFPLGGIPLDEPKLARPEEWEQRLIMPNMRCQI